MVYFKIVGLIVLAMLSSITSARDIGKSIDDVDFSRMIENDLLVFAPFDWSEHRGVVWYKDYTYEYRYGQTNASGMRPITIYLLAKAHANEGEFYNSFVANAGIKDEKIRLYDNEQFHCDTSDEFSRFVKMISGRTPVVKSVGDSRILCQVSFKFIEGWETRIEKFIADQTAFDLDVTLPLCEQSSPKSAIGPIMDILITNGVFTQTNNQYQANLYDAIYDIAVLSQQSPTLFSHRPKEMSMKLFTVFTQNTDSQTLSMPVNDIEQSIKLCDPKPVTVAITGAG